MLGFTCVRVAADYLISSVAVKSIPLGYVISGNSDVHLSILAIAAAFGVFANFFLSLTTLQSSLSAKATRRSTTPPAPLLTVASHN